MTKWPSPWQVDFLLRCKVKFSFGAFMGKVTNSIAGVLSFVVVALQYAHPSEAFFRYNYVFPQIGPADQDGDTLDDSEDGCPTRPSVATDSDGDGGSGRMPVAQ